MKELVVVAAVVAAGCDRDEGMITHLRDLQIFMEPGQCLGNTLALGSRTDLARERKEFQRHTPAL